MSLFLEGIAVEKQTSRIWFQSEWEGLADHPWFIFGGMAPYGSTQHVNFPKNSVLYREKEVWWLVVLGPLCSNVICFGGWRRWQQVRKYIYIFLWVNNNLSCTKEWLHFVPNNWTAKNHAFVCVWFCTKYPIYLCFFCNIWSLKQKSLLSQPISAYLRWNPLRASLQIFPQCSWNQYH